MAITQKVFTSRVNILDSTLYVGEAGRLFYAQPDTPGVAPSLRYSDGVTVGGLAISGGGLAATINVGTVSVSTNTVAVTNTGTTSDAYFNFVLQSGPPGPPGSIGVQGPTGAGITIKGSVSTSTDLPLSCNAQNDGYIDTGDSNLYVWTGTGFLNVGQIVGPQGAQGLQGLQGLQGNCGTQGVQGTIGAQGIVGAQGLQGVQGVIGAQGPQGVQGVIGAQGVQGISIQGLQGAQGGNGIQGYIGSQGLQGVQGNYGIQGCIGAQGIQGCFGAQGIQGCIGAQGLQGPQGCIGAQGIQGCIGAQGGTGLQGCFGAQGIQGCIGAQGIQGCIGAQGSTGLQGCFGAQGIQGCIGAQGGNGLQGCFGAQGLQGPQGCIGLPGCIGAQGLQGPQGCFGTQGLQGVQGATGGGGASTSTRWDATLTEPGNNCPIYAELTPDHFQAFTQQSNLAIRNDGSWNIGSNYNGTGLYGLGNTATLYSNYGDVAIRVNESQSYFTFGTDGLLTLPYGQSIGSGSLDGIKMTTDRGTVLFGNSPECVPTLLTHFHIMKQDASAVDLFLGDDNNYVKLPGSGETAYGVEIGTNVGSAYIWRFGTDGVITLPSGNTRIGSYNGSDVIIGSTGTGVGVVSQGQGGYVALEWISDYANIGTTASTQVAAVVVNSPIASSSGTVQIATGLVTGPTAQNVWEFGADGSITFPDNTVQTTAYVTGNQLIWAATDTGNGSITQAVAYDSQGNSYSLISQGNINNSGVFPATIVKRSGTGSELWKIDLGTDHSVNPWSLVCDGDNNLYVIVQRLNGSVYNNVVLKLNGINGSILWQVDIQDSQAANNMQAVPFSGYIGMGPSSGVVVAGTAYNGNDNDFFITAIGADGSFIATNTYGDQWDQEAYSVAINPMSLDVVLVGRKKSNTDNAYYLEIIKFVSGAPPAWQKSITVDGNYDVQGTDVCLLPDGNWAVVATHQIDNTNGGHYGVITMKINNTDGSVMWSREISQGCSNISSSIVTDSAGNIYMSAMTYSGNNTPGGNVPITNRLIGAYDTNGNALWQKYFRTFDTSEVLVDPNWWNEIGSTGKQLAVYNDRLLVGTSVVTLGQSGPTGASAVVVQLTTQGENETIGAYETRNSYLTDSAVSLTVADTVFDYTTSTQTLSTGTSVSTASSTLTFSLDHTGAYVSQLKNSGKTVTLEPNGTLLDGNGRNVTGEFDGVTDSGNNFSNNPIGIRNASGYKRLVGLTNSAQTWFDINDVATQLGVNPAWIMGVTIEYNVVSSNLNNNGSMTGQIIIASSNNSAWAISVTHSEAVLTTSNSSNDVVFANLNLWQPNGWTLQAIRTDSNSQQLDIIWTAKVFINASEAYC